MGFGTCHPDGVLTERGLFQDREVMESIISSPVRHHSLKLKNEPQSHLTCVNGPMKVPKVSPGWSWFMFIWGVLITDMWLNGNVCFKASWDQTFFVCLLACFNICLSYIQVFPPGYVVSSCFAQGPQDFQMSPFFFSWLVAAGVLYWYQALLANGMGNGGYSTWRTWLGFCLRLFGKVTLHPQSLSASLQSNEKSIKHLELLFKDPYSS